MKTKLLYIALLCTILSSCGKEEELPLTKAMIIEASCWFIKTDSSTYYLPECLDNKFRIDSLAILINFDELPFGQYIKCNDVCKSHVALSYTLIHLNEVKRQN